MKKYVLLLLCLLSLQACTRYKEATLSFPDGKTMPVKIADTYKKQERAWLGQKAPFTKGVLVVFLRQEEQTYWRKNLLLDLDVIFLDSQFRITAIYPHVPHRQKYTIDAEIPYAFATAKYLLELPAATAGAHGLKEKDILLVEGLPASAQKDL